MLNPDASASMASFSFLADSGQKAKADLNEVHEESIVLIKDAEDLLGKGEMDAARDQFQAALDRCASV